MIWSFARGSTRMDIEVRRAPESGGYELVVDYPDGSETVRCYHNPRRLVKRTLRVQRRLLRQGWEPLWPASVGAGRTSPPRSARHGILQTIARVQRTWMRRLAACFGL